MVTLLRFLILLFCAVTGISSYAQVYINEFMASNGEAHWDIEEKSYADWIELYNGGNDTVDLAGYFLTDNLSRLKKWKIPELTVIAPKGYVLLWADRKNKGVHTNFSLNIRKEAVGLSDTEGNPIDTMSYSSQLRNVSYGREEDGADRWVFFEQHTAGSTNNISSGSALNKRGPRPGFSLNGGFFNTVRRCRFRRVRNQRDGNCDMRLHRRRSPRRV